MANVARADYNRPTHNPDNVIVGQGAVLASLYTAPAVAGITPAQGMGAIDGLTLRTASERVTLKQGTPLVVVGEWNMDETVEFEFDGWEFDPVKELYSYGAGACSTSGSTDIFTFGGDWTLQNCSLMVQYQMSNGGCIFFDIWRAIGKGNIEYTFVPNEKMKITRAFTAREGAGDWVGGTLSAGQRYFRLRRVNPP